MVKKIIIGKVSKQQKDLKGWLVGQFLSEGTPFKDNNIEICYKTFQAGDKSDKLHYHPQGKEYLIVISGEAIMRVGDEIIDLQQGDYIAIPNSTSECLMEVKTDFSIIGVRYPSIPNNKVFLK